MQKTIELEVTLKWEYFPAQTGGSHPHGGDEQIPHSVQLTSAKATRQTGHGEKQVELITVLDADTIEALESEILETYD